MGKELLTILSVNHLNYQLELGRRRSTKSTSSLLHLLAGISHGGVLVTTWSMVVALSGAGEGLGATFTGSSCHRTMWLVFQVASCLVSPLSKCRRTNRPQYFQLGYAMYFCPLSLFSVLKELLSDHRDYQNRPGLNFFSGLVMQNSGLAPNGT